MWFVNQAGLLKRITQKYGIQSPLHLSRLVEKKMAPKNDSPQIQNQYWVFEQVLVFKKFTSENTKVQILEKKKKMLTVNTVSEKREKYQPISLLSPIAFRNIWFPQFRLNLTLPTHTVTHTRVYHAGTPLSQFASIAAQLMIPLTIHF